MLSACPSNAPPVPIADSNLQSHALDNIIALGEPVLFRDTWENCPAVERWDFAHLKECVGQQIIEAEYYPNARRDRACTFLEMPLEEYLERLESDPPSRKLLYLAEYPIERVVPTILDEFNKPEALANQPNLRELLFVGYDSVTTAHYHRGRTQALLGQITGTKTVVLFPPKQIRLLGMHPWYSLRPNHSKLPWGEAEYNSIVSDHPATADTKPLACTVHPGQLLFIPDHWVQYVVSDGPTVSVTWFWESKSGTGYRPGVRRDKWSACAKSSMQVAARAAAMTGLQHLLVRLAGKTGIIHPEEQPQVQDYLDRFGTKLPSEQHTH
ncbi:MAG: cupin-like domain-containing protein [Planctomycetota bacterium]